MNRLKGPDEFDLKEIILTIEEYVKEIWSKKFLVIIASILFACILLLREFRKPINYSGELTFMVNEDDGGSIGGAAAILGQLGLGAASGSEYNLEKIISLSKSRRIAQSILFDTIEVNGQNDFIANHIIRLYDYHEHWKRNEKLKLFYFKHNKVSEFSKLENLALKVIFNKLSHGENHSLIAVEVDDNTGILSIRSRTYNQNLSVAITELLYGYLSKFYVEQSLNKQQFTLKVLENKADSISLALENTEYQLAKLLDNSQGFRLRTTQIKEQELSREIQILTISYGELLKNIAAAEFFLETARPFFQVIDFPVTPLDETRKEYFKRLIFGLLLGGIIGVLFVSGRHLVVKVMSN